MSSLHALSVLTFNPVVTERSSATDDVARVLNRLPRLKVKSVTCLYDIRWRFARVVYRVWLCEETHFCDRWEAESV